MKNWNENKNVLNNNDNEKAPSCVQPINPIYTSKEKAGYQFNGNVWNRYGSKDTHVGTFTFILQGDKKPQDIVKLIFVNASKCKVSWGSLSEESEGTINDYLIKGEYPFTKYASNAVACGIWDVPYPNTAFHVMWGKITDIAVMRYDQYINFNWFNDGKNNYFQIFYTQYGETWSSAVGGGMWLNLGDYLEIIFK